MRACRHAEVLLWAAVFVLAAPISLRAQSTSVPEKYRPYIVLNVDHRGIFQKGLNLIGKSSVPVGRSFALLAGVTRYPNLPLTQQVLEAASIDLDNLQRYLRDQEYFDVIVVLKDGDMNYENLHYFLTNYFPQLLTNSANTRFLFAYSGHGYAVGSGVTARGYLLTSAATSLKDEVNRLPMDVLRSLMGPAIDKANHALVLVNASTQARSEAAGHASFLNPTATTTAPSCHLARPQHHIHRLARPEVAGVCKPCTDPAPGGVLPPAALGPPVLR
jgi:hypothetical protein